MATTDRADLYVLRGSESWRDPYPAYRELRDADPVHRVDHPEHGEFWVLSRFKETYNETV